MQILFCMSEVNPICKPKETCKWIEVPKLIHLHEIIGIVSQMPQFGGKLLACGLTFVNDKPINTNIQILKDDVIHVYVGRRL